MSESGKVTVNGTEYSKSDYSSWLEDNEYGIVNGTDKQIKLDGAAFDYKKDNTIVIEVEGYKTLTVTVHSNGSYTASSDSEQENSKEAPQPGDFEKDTMGFGGNKLHFYYDRDNESLVMEYLQSITDVTVNGSKYTTGDGGWGIADNVFDNSSAANTDKYL